MATSSGRIQIVSPERPGRPGEGFTRARLMADVAIAATVGDDAPDDMRPIALSAGFLDPDEPPVMLAGPPSAPRKMVVAVATAGGTVLCFDHNLRPLWSKRLQPDGLPEGTFYSEAALLVSPQRVMDHDRGAVLVGLALERGDSIWGGGGVEVQPVSILSGDVRRPTESSREHSLADTPGPYQTRPHS